MHCFKKIIASFFLSLYALIIAPYMMKLLVLPFFLFFLSLTVSAQSIKVEDRSVRKIIEKIEKYPIELIDVKTLKKYKALELSREMKSKMDYNVVRVKYKTLYSYKTVIIDLHLVPILIKSKRIPIEEKGKNKYESVASSNYN